MNRIGCFYAEITDYRSAEDMVSTVCKNESCTIFRPHPTTEFIGRLVEFAKQAKANIRRAPLWKKRKAKMRLLPTMHGKCRSICGLSTRCLWRPCGVQGFPFGKMIRLLQEVQPNKGTQFIFSIGTTNPANGIHVSKKNVTDG